MIVINDLDQAVDLDRQAMTALRGGARQGSAGDWQRWSAVKRIGAGHGILGLQSGHKRRTGAGNAQPFGK